MGTRRYLSVSEFARLTGTPEATIRDRCERGYYRVRPGHVAGKKWAILASEVDRYGARVR
ncbi:MAG: hypothetical protein WCP21_16855 [Armatimonadota bacterium]